MNHRTLFRDDLRHEREALKAGIVKLIADFVLIFLGVYVLAVILHCLRLMP